MMFASVSCSLVLLALASFSRRMAYAEPYDMLYQLMSREWEDVVSHFESYPIHAKITTGGLFPLHFACLYKAPLEVVEVLLQAHPEAVRVRDLTIYGTPLHHLFYDKFETAPPTIDVVKRIIAAGPEAARIRDGDGDLPLHVAARRDDISESVFMELLKSYPNGASVADSLGCLPFHIAYSSMKTPKYVISALFNAYPEAIRIDPIGMIGVKFQMKASPDSASCSRAECKKLLNYGDRDHDSNVDSRPKSDVTSGNESENSEEEMLYLSEKLDEKRQLVMDLKKQIAEMEFKLDRAEEKNRVLKKETTLTCKGT